MKRFYLLFFSILIAPICLLANINYQIQINSSELSFSQREGYDIIEIYEYEMMNITAVPMLPVKGLNFIIPSNQKVVEISITNIIEEELSDDFTIFPAQPERIIDYEWLDLPDIGFIEPDSAIYTVNAFYPEANLENIGIQYKAGTKINSILFYPLHYNPVTQKVKLTTNIEFTLIFGDNDADFVKPKRLSRSSYQQIKKQIEKLVNNHQDVVLYFQPDTIEEEIYELESFIPSEIPSLFGSNVAYVIITSENLESDFQQIANWKTKRGMPSVVRTTEWIYSNYSGCDNSEKIRTFIIDAFENWGTIWFMLGGDDNIIPLRYAWISHFNHSQLIQLIPNGEFIPCDMYYACLDGNWNADGDATFGEGSWDRSNDGSFYNAGNNATSV